MTSSDTTDLFGSNAALRSILNPASVAIVGASSKEATMAGAPLRNLLRHGFGGRIFPVNPNRDEISGVKTYPSIADIPEVPDTAVLVVPADKVPNALRDCANLGIRTATVIASSTDNHADDGQNSVLASVLLETGMRIVGPNTAGLINVIDNYAPRAAMNHPARLPVGNVAVITQSGALCNTLSNRAMDQGLGLAYMIAAGDQLDLDLWDFAAYALEDARVQTVAMVIEGLKSPEKFLKVANRARQLGKPILTLKIGISEVGRRVVATHTGALSGASDVQAAVFDEWNIVAVKELDELWEVAQLFQSWGVPTRRVSGVGVISMSGGEAAFAADEASRSGIELPRLSPETHRKLDSLSPLATASNPFDSAGGVMSRPELIGDAVSIMLEDPGLDAVLVASPVFAGIYAERLYKSIVEAQRSAGHPRVAISAWTAGEMTRPGQTILRESGLPVFVGAHRAIRAIGYYERYGAAIQRPTPSDMPFQSGAEHDLASAPTTYWSAREILSQLGVPYNDAELVENAEEAAAAAERIGVPVSMKLSKLEMVHKADHNALWLCLSSQEEIKRAANHLTMLGGAGGAWLPGEGIVVEKYFSSTSGVLVGGTRDPEFGPILLFGLGGGYAETYADVAHATCPFDAERAERLIRKTLIGSIIGRKPETLAKFVEMLTSLSQWFANSPEIRAFDINPLLIDINGHICAVDARVVTPDSGQMRGVSRIRLDLPA